MQIRGRNIYHEMKEKGILSSNQCTRPTKDLQTAAAAAAKTSKGSHSQRISSATPASSNPCALAWNKDRWIWLVGEIQRPYIMILMILTGLKEPETTTGQDLASLRVHDINQITVNTFFWDKAR